jgi:lipopolysaccharide biosynthesis glycosyltransferase
MVSVYVVFSTVNREVIAMGTRFLYTAADANYFDQAAVLVKSLSATQHHETELKVFGNGWNHAQVTRLKEVCFNNVSVDVIPVDRSKFSEIKLSHGFPLATVYNIIAPKFLLQEYEQAIYVDADVVILDDLGDVWNQDLIAPVSAVIDSHVGFIGSPSMWRPWRELGANPKAPYLNTGLLKINLNMWCEQKITERCLDLLTSYELPCVDQDALNLTLNGEFDFIHPRYNLMPYHLMKKLRNVDVLEDPAAIQDAITDPAIIHFHRSFLGKPWVRGCIHPARKLWTSIADEASPKWRKSIDLMGTLKQTAAKYAKVSVLDESGVSLSRLRASNISRGA